MELIKSAGRRTRFNELVYILFTILLPLALFGLIKAFDGGPIPALILVILSKWRMFAVKPRFWFINIKSNLVDIIVGVGIVLMLSITNDHLYTQIGLTALFVAWLLLLKPKSRRKHVMLQALIGLIIGLVALFTYSQYFNAAAVVILAAIIGYASARHTVSAHDEDHIEALSLIWGLVVAEISWLLFHWTIAYSIYAGIVIPQAAVLIGIAAFAAYSYYDNSKKEDPELERTKVRWTIIICGLLTALVLFVSKWSASI